ncbi:hypothetical protein LXA43DRAFT_879974 [Ganoderma leucocontextum]|nr:hypothetical protein LXA43DRAFT_879974 [Ganoderma leucocontextum]
MNFLDTYDISGTATTPTNTQPTQSLNEEVTEVVGQLSRFWGGFRKQSQVAFEAARKDLGSVVQQAQKELTKLTAETPAASSTAPEPSTSATEQAPSASVDAADAPSTPSSSADTTSTEATDKTVPESSPSSPSQSSQPQTIFARLQASLPPALVNVQSQLPDSLKETLEHARVGGANLTALDFAQLRSTIATELQRVQGATEEYVHRSEDFLREAGEFLKDAVKVVPPEEGDSGYPGLIWDGTDVWMLPMASGTVSPSPAASNNDKGKEREASGSSVRPSVDTLRAVATRAELMLKQLRHDPEVIKVDPKDDANVRDMYTNWLATEAASEDRGLGTTPWQNKTERALADPVDGAALKATMDILVPEALRHDEFWTRYFFRVHQVEREEARRKAIIQGTTENDEDFSWEDDDEETVSPTVKLPTTPSPTVSADQPKVLAAPLVASATEVRSLGSTPANLSPRQSSEESYDVVSSQVSNSGTVDGSAGKVKAVPKEGGEDGDEDEEEEEEEEEGEEEEAEGEEEGEEGEEEEEEEDDEEEVEEDSDWE